MPDRFKCRQCYLILDREDLVEDKCPTCNNPVEKMCIHDKICQCAEDMYGGINVCPECNAFTCKCGSHDVMVTSRITGYLSEANGWNSGKLAELKDRTRYVI